MSVLSSHLTYLSLFSPPFFIITLLSVILHIFVLKSEPRKLRASHIFIKLTVRFLQKSFWPLQDMKKSDFS